MAAAARVLPHKDHAVKEGSPSPQQFQQTLDKTLPAEQALFKLRLLLKVTHISSWSDGRISRLADQQRLALKQSRSESGQRSTHFH